MRKIFLLLMPTILFLISCEKKFLDTLPKGLVIAEKTSDFRMLLDNADTRYNYNLSQVSAYVDVVSDDSQLDSTWYDWERARLHAKHLYSFETDIWLPDGPAEDAVWKQNYYVSSLMSNILEEIHIATDNPKIQKQLIAEAKAHRASAYLTLINVYAKHYNKATAANDAGVPLFTNPVELPSLERASVQRVYDFIISELLASVSDLPDNIEMQFSHRPTKVSTYALLARAYLYMGNFEKALEYSDKSLKINDFLYDYNTIYTGAPSPSNVKELSRISDKEMLLHKTLVKGVRLSEYYMLDSISFNTIYSGYEEVNDSTVDNHDLRRVLWFEGINSRGQLTARRARYTFSRERYRLDNAMADYTPLSTSEMYLTRAEAYARLNNLDKALEDVNKIRRHRYKTGTYTSITAAGLSQDAVLAEVLLERRRELYGKELRLFDVKRLGLPVSHLQPGTMNPGFQIPANDPKMVWPVFYRYIELNPEIGQTPR